jgi:hypothetical protein
MPMLMLSAALVCPMATMAAGSYSAEAYQPPVVGVDASYLGDAVGSLRDAVANSPSDGQIYAQANALFGNQIPSQATTYGGNVRLKGWTKPVIHSEEFKRKQEREDISVGGISDRVYNTLMASEVPPPTEVIDSYLYGEELEKAGLSAYDAKNALGKGVLGLYKYTKDSAIGVFFNRSMKTVQSWVGNEFAAATKMHEDGHARDHMRGQLNPVQVKKGETQAYRTEYEWLKIMDPTGEKLSWARATIGKFAQGSRKAPEFVGKYLEHLAMIRRFGDSDDFAGLVVALGYRDRSDNPFHDHGNAEQGSAEVGHAHDGEDCDCKNQMLDHATEPADAAVTVHYVDYPG